MISNGNFAPKSMKIRSLGVFLRRYLLRLVVCVGSACLLSCNAEKRSAQRVLKDRNVEVSEATLFRALEEGDLALADALLKLGQEAKGVDEGGRTSLMLAAGGRGSSLVRELVEAGSDLNAKDGKGKTALHYAVEANNLDAVMGLVEKGADLDLEVEKGGSLVASALKGGRFAVVGMFLESGVNPDSVDEVGQSLVRIAARQNQPVILEKLVKRGVDLSKNRVGEESLPHLALGLKNHKVLRFLLENGVNPDVRSQQGDGLVHGLVRESQSDLLELLKEKEGSLDALDPDGWAPLHLAVLGKNEEVLRTLIDLGAGVDVLSQGGMAPIALAHRDREFGMMKALLDAGAEGGDEMYVAAKRGAEDGLKGVRMLLASGMSATKRQVSGGESPLAVAVRQGDLEIVKVLVEAGAPIDVVDRTGQKSYLVAVAKLDYPMVEYLLDQGAQVDEPYQTESLSEEFLGLVKSGNIAKSSLKKKPLGFTPLMMVADAGDVKLAQLLVKRGANTKANTKMGPYRRWVTYFSTRRGDTDVTQVLFKRKPGKTPVWVKVDLSEQRAYVYKDGKVVLKASISSGKKGHRTRKGKFVITRRHRNWTSTLYDVEMPYFQRLSESDFGFHVGVLPGYPASKGCIRMSTSSARKLWGLTTYGDYVEIVQ